MEIIGHKKILDFLDESIRNNKVSHSYLFVGPPGVGKRKVAFEFAKKLVAGKMPFSERHPDIIVADEEETIKIEHVRDLIHTLSLSPHSLPYKIAILHDIERLTREAANALLKTLEEPASRSILILIASDIQQVLPTIISRCQIVRFYPVHDEVLQKGLEDSGFSVSQEIMQLASGRPGIALQMLENKDFFNEKHAALQSLKETLSKNIPEKFSFAKEISEKENIFQILDDWTLCFREELRYTLKISQHTLLNSRLSVQRIREIISTIVKTKSSIEHTNVNTLLALENLMLVMGN